MAQELPIQSLSSVEIVYCCVVMVLAYAARGSTGFGAAAAMPLLGLVIPLKVLIPAWTLIGLAAGVTLLGRDRKNIAWRQMIPLLPGCLVGIAVGLYVFESLDARTLERRLARAEAEEANADRFDAVVVNDDVDRAVGELVGLLVARRGRTD